MSGLQTGGHVWFTNMEVVIRVMFEYWSRKRVLLFLEAQLLDLVPQDVVLVCLTTWKVDNLDFGVCD